MSIQFNDTVNLKGLAQFYAREIGLTNPTDITGSDTKMKEFASYVNLALDDFWAVAIPASGTWQLDDSNQSDLPIIKGDINSGQRDYTFVSDESGNLILDIYKVAILPSATATLYQEIYPIDVQSDDEAYDLLTEDTNGGTPYRYDKTANGFFLDPVPNYSATLGLKVYINREASYFTYQDTTKKPGVPGLFHAYFYLRPALEYARRNDLAKERKLKEKVMEMEKAIVEYFGKRERDTIDQLIPEPINYL